MAILSSKFPGSSPLASSLCLWVSQRVSMLQCRCWPNTAITLQKCKRVKISDMVGGISFESFWWLNFTMFYYSTMFQQIWWVACLTLECQDNPRLYFDQCPTDQPHLGQRPILLGRGCLGSQLQRPKALRGVEVQGFLVLPNGSKWGFPEMGVPL